MTSGHPAAAAKQTVAVGEDLAVGDIAGHMRMPHAEV